MNGKILDGKKLAEKLNSELSVKIKSAIEKTGATPQLATILVGNDPASKIYVNIKHRTCESVGIKSIIVELEEDIAKEDLLNEIDNLNKDNNINSRKPKSTHIYVFRENFTIKRCRWIKSNY